MTTKINIPDFLKLKKQEPLQSKTQSKQEIVLEIMRLIKLLESRGKESKRDDYVNDVKQSQQNYLKQLNQYTE